MSRCSELVIVDEAHTCAGSGAGRHQRYDLLRSLAADAARHLLLLTATPHSGDEASFHHLLGLPNPEFEKLAVLTGHARERFRLPDSRARCGNNSTRPSGIGSSI